MRRSAKSLIGEIRHLEKRLAEDSADKKLEDWAGDIMEEEKEIAEESTGIAAKNAALLKTIKALEEKIAMPSYMYMDEDLSHLDDDVMLDDDLMNGGGLYMDEDMSYMDEDMEEMSYMYGAEDGIEDTIEEPFSEMVDEFGSGDAGDMLEDAAGHALPTASYTERLQEASARLDRVASYLEKQGNKRLARRLDVLANTIDSELKRS